MEANVSQTRSAAFSESEIVTASLYLRYTKTQASVIHNFIL